MKDGVAQTLALPFVYALLENKMQPAYEKVFEVVVDLGAGMGTQLVPHCVMSDFELGIINAAKGVFGDVVAGCLFHMSNAVYRQIQSGGLQNKYNDRNDRTIQEATQMMCALAFVPVTTVRNHFTTFLVQVPADFKIIAQYFDVTYVRRKLARGSRRGVPARYPPSLWNQYDAVINRLCRTNNASEGCRH